MTKDPDFKGYIHDVGGPTADFRQPACKKQLTKGACTNRQCLFPTPCKNLIADHSDYLALLRKLRKIPKVKKVFIRSGIRFDYVLEDTKSHFLQELADYHVSGQLRVAPEHVADKVLEKMGKPSHKVYLEFLKQYYACCKKSGKEQYAVPYFMSSHPGCGLKEAVELAEYIRDLGYMPEILTDCEQGVAREVGARLGALARENASCGTPRAFILGGETVVRLTGNGKGGRNQELALAAAAEIAGTENIVVFSVGSDGTDGPTDAAGGFADCATWDRLRAVGLSPDAILADNDAYHALDAVGGLIRTGATGTNVNDLSVVLIDG